MDGAVVVNAGLGQRLSVTVDDFPIENQFYLKDAKARVSKITWKGIRIWESTTCGGELMKETIDTVRRVILTSDLYDFRILSIGFA